jgi:peptidoglycan DL-endopeptidase CwlO
MLMVIHKIKIMFKTVSIPEKLRQLRALGAAVALAALVSGAAVAHADIYDEQINALQSQNNAARGVLNGLTAEASSYQDTINKLQAEINAVVAAIAANQAQQTELQAQITEAQRKIDEQKAYLSENITAMYIDGQLSTIEELATSSNLSEYVDKEEYRTGVQNKLDSSIKEIGVLQEQLKKQKAELEQLLVSQQAQNAQLDSARAQQQSLLDYNEGQQAAYNSQITSNQGRIGELRRAQIAANSRFTGAPGTGPACGGGYPAKWCEIPQDSVIDSWGMYNRECVSYTAFKVHIDYLLGKNSRDMPYWGGVGNANQWDDNARRANMRVDTNPEPGAIAVSNAGYYGHVMYVESVNGDGTFNISQYNAALDGRYSTRNGVSVGNLVFIHF